MASDGKSYLPGVSASRYRHGKKPDLNIADPNRKQHKKPKKNKEDPRKCDPRAHRKRLSKHQTQKREKARERKGILQREIIAPQEFTPWAIDEIKESAPYITLNVSAEDLLLWATDQKTFWAREEKREKEFWEKYEADEETCHNCWKSDCHCYESDTEDEREICSYCKGEITHGICLCDMEDEPKCRHCGSHPEECGGLCAREELYECYDCNMTETAYFSEGEDEYDRDVKCSSCGDYLC